ncbi:hypothetical protein SAVERM_113 [Streptomyces avermitilis MA-4680 = NBRC 14893]|uniref:Uncharacterized protein n=1 Tax=Streptomyces avermitilis (strain ATCC 31267 / DSM 46492 / JCM 5070 / NBRC 14893 / NCIMB 12804 / NRRL 8165 / MA-4680) TaxID=227882 RepID=Q82RN0_STRAW|nr:hypothetical protein SAVERM_113 [Streptomyces avermitilis MA-4680 = NBRC 14893]
MLRARPGRDEGEREMVHRLASARKAPKVVVERCRTVELSWGGWLVPQIADELRCGVGQARTTHPNPQTPLHVHRLRTALIGLH